MYNILRAKTFLLQVWMLAWLLWFSLVRRITRQSQCLPHIITLSDYQTSWQPLLSSVLSCPGLSWPNPWHHYWHHRIRGRQTGGYHVLPSPGRERWWQSGDTIWCDLIAPLPPARVTDHTEIVLTVLTDVTAPRRYISSWFVSPVIGLTAILLLD